MDKDIKIILAIVSGIMTMLIAVACVGDWDNGYRLCLLAAGIFLVCLELLLIFRKEIKEGLQIIKEDAEASQVKPDKDVLRGRLLEVLVSEKEKRQNDVETYAFCILKQSGWLSFASKKLGREAQRRLTRLLANGNEEAIVAYLKKIVDSL